MGTTKTIWHPLIRLAQANQVVMDGVCPLCGTSLSTIMLTPGHGLSTSSSTCRLGSPPPIE